MGKLTFSTGTDITGCCKFQTGSKENKIGSDGGCFHIIYYVYVNSIDFQETESSIQMLNILMRNDVSGLYYLAFVVLSSIFVL